MGMMMRRLTGIDWAAIAIGFSGVLLSVIALSANVQILYDIGGILTWLAVAVAVYGFVTRSLK